MFGLGLTELIIIGVVIFFIFGAKRLPDIGKGLGGALREFRNIKKEISSDDTIKTDLNDAQKKEVKGSSRSLETELGEKMLQQVPGVRKAYDFKKKAEKVNKLIK